MDAGEDRRIADRRAPALGGTKSAHELAERGQVVGLVSNHEVLVVDAERVGQQLAHLRVTVADLHVLVHHALPGVLVGQVPISRLREGIHDQVARTLAAEQRLLLRRGLLHVLRRLDQSKEALPHGKPGPHAAAQGGSRRFLERLER